MPYFRQCASGSFANTLVVPTKRKPRAAGKPWLHSQASGRDGERIDASRDPFHHNRTLFAASQA